MVFGRILVAAAALSIVLAGCSPFEKSRDPSSGMRLFPHAAFSSKHDELAKSVEQDPFPKAGQASKAVNAQVLCQQ
jgi:hypothetical protein